MSVPISEALSGISRPIRARIDLAAIRHNFSVARRLAGKARVWAVIKANAYGHGQLKVACALRDMADGFAVLEVETALTLRAHGIKQPILLLEGFFAPGDIAALALHELTPVIHCEEQLCMLEAAPMRPRHAYIKLNSGMNRLGLRPSEALAAQRRLETLGIGDLTLMNHFAHADSDEGIAEQWPVCQAVAQASGLPTSFANSAALIRFPESRGGEQDWVRPGIMLYGASPFADQTATDLGLRPAMTLESRLIGVQTLAPGERVGYGGCFVADAPMKIGTVACGYADGYPRHAPTGTPIAVAGKRTRVLGRVSMDMLACDLSLLPEATVGSPVTLWGCGAGGSVDADAVARAAGTIGYELFCAVAPRVPKSWTR